MAGLTERPAARRNKGPRKEGQPVGACMLTCQAALNAFEWYCLDFNGPLCAWGHQAFPAVRQEADVGIKPSHRGGSHREAGGAAVPWAAGTHAGDGCHGDGTRPAPCAWATSFLSGDGRQGQGCGEFCLSLFPVLGAIWGSPWITQQSTDWQGKTRSRPLA